MSSAPRRLTVATYNVYLGADLALLFGVSSADELAGAVAVVRDQLERTDFAQRAAAIARLLVREHIDVVGLQVVSRWASAPVSPEGAMGTEQVVADFLPVLLDALTAAGSPYDVHAVNHNFAGGLPVDGSWMSIQGANVVLVRRGGAFTVSAERTGTFDSGFAVTTGLEGVTFPINRSWGWVEGEVDGGRFLIANTHTEAYDAATRDAQRDELLAVIGHPGCPVAVVGDFNAEPSQVGMPAPYVDAWTAAGRDPSAGHTCGQAPDLVNEGCDLRERIDYVFVRDAEVQDCRLVGDREEDRTTPGRLWPSDHAGVVARLGF
ncbi:MAG: endonuclease/exonuclease/phosphatase family protein [Nocardioides sp.]